VLEHVHVAALGVLAQLRVRGLDAGAEEFVVARDEQRGLRVLARPAIAASGRCRSPASTTTSASVGGGSMG